MLQAEINKRFDYHKPDAAKGARHEEARAAVKVCAEKVSTLCVEGRELATAMTHLETAMFWVNAAIAREDA